MFGTDQISELPLSLASVRNKVKAFLEANGLRFDGLDRYFAICSEQGEICAGAGTLGNIIKAVAINEKYRSEGLLAPIVSHISASLMIEGADNIFIFTAPDKIPTFRSLAFHEVGCGPNAAMLESDPRGIKNFTDSLRSIPRAQRNGVIVMNCNPFTLGHLYLVEQAAERVDHLTILLVAEDKSDFTLKNRLVMVKNGTAHIKNVIIATAGPYQISSATFPSYFLKDLSKAAEEQILLDLDIFNRHIAPALSATVRFAGTEPSDPLTARYNQLMRQHLKIDFEELPRLEIDGEPVSASNVRKLLSEGKLAKALKLLPPASQPFILAKAATLALTRELNLAPKPGLVDPLDAGAHTDMDHTLMTRSIEALEPWFARLATSPLSHEQIVDIGLQAEKDMLRATNGVNTHKGALFSMGLMLQAFIRGGDLQQQIARLAQEFEDTHGTHGASVHEKYGLPTALDNARSGYSSLFSSWLPFYKSHKHEPNALHLLLLKIMAELDDSNIVHRSDIDTLQEVKRRAQALLESPGADLENNLSLLNSEFIARNLSPGGAADMLALTLLTDYLTTI